MEQQWKRRESQREKWTVTVSLLEYVPATGCSLTKACPPYPAASESYSVKVDRWEGGSETMQWWLTNCKLKTLTSSICAFSTSACRLWRSKQMDNTELCLYVHIHVHAASGHYWKQVATMDKNSVNFLLQTLCRGDSQAFQRLLAVKMKL